MGHTIQHYDYPGNADKKKVEQELANYVAKRCFQEGGHLSKIRWIDSEPCANEDEAHEKIERLDKGWYHFGFETETDDEGIIKCDTLPE